MLCADAGPLLNPSALTHPRNKKGTRMSAFVWTTPDGTIVNLPPMSAITAGMLRRYRKLPELDFMFSILEDLLDADEMAKLDALPLPVVQDMFVAWQADEGATVPQS